MNLYQTLGLGDFTLPTFTLPTYTLPTIGGKGVAVKTPKFGLTTPGAFPTGTAPGAHAAQSPSAGGSSTGLIVGVVAAVAIIAVLAVKA